MSKELVKEIRDHLGHQWSDRTYVQSEKVRDIMRRAADRLELLSANDQSGSSQREMARIIADATSMSSKDLRAMSTIILMAAEISPARETGKVHPAPAPTDG